MKTTLAIAVQTLLFAVIPPNAVVAQRTTLSEEAVVALTGNWSGTIVVDQTRSQDVLWRFERAPSGELTGLMGPAAMGAPTIPMQNIESDGIDLSFTVDSQFGEYVGRISDGEAMGTWRQGQTGTVILTRSDADAGGDVPDGGAYSIVLGPWEGRQGGSPDGPPNSFFRFELGDSGELIGFAGDSPEAVGTPLESVALVGSELSFQAPASPPTVREFTGDISGGTATGVWFQGVEASITMRRSAAGG